MRVAPAQHHFARQARARDILRAESLDALLVTSAPNIAYLTGFFGSAGALLVGTTVLRLIVDGRYLEAATLRQQALPGLDVALVPATGSQDETIAAEVVGLNCARMGFEASHLSVREHHDLVSRLAAGEVKMDLRSTEGLLEGLRAVKDDWEIGTLREAGRRLSDVAKCIIQKVLAGSIERAMAALIDGELRRVGFDKPAFDTIVASGPNAAMPHYRTGDRRLEDGDLVVLDFGGMLDGYSVDLTRTVSVGPPGPRERRVLEQVAAAQAAAFRSIATGQLACAVDEAARQVLEREGLGEAFSHATGHGLGLEIHERPRVGRRRAGRADEPLEAGMVFTLEPGAYFPGWGGVRIEDDVLVTADGGEWLTDVPRVM